MQAPSPAVDPPDANPQPDATARLASLDAYRGAVMLFMASNGLGLAQVARRHPDSPLWRFLGFHTSHVPWVGGGAWDMIQPSFMFMVGMAVPFSLAHRLRAGEPRGRFLAHAVRRALVLIALGVLLAAVAQGHPRVVFTNVLAQIGLGYVFLLPLAGRGLTMQAATATCIAVACWAAFAAWPLPSPDIDLAALGVGPGLVPATTLPGFFAHWNMNTNVAAAFDRWFLNLFPRPEPFVFNAGGYTTLNFVPALITMILGLVAGEALRRPDSPRAKFRWLLAAGAACAGLGLLAGATVCPIVKRIWTPSFALWSGGICLWVLAAFFWTIDVRGWRRWAGPLVVVGMNPIAIYLAHALLAGLIKDRAARWLGGGLLAGPLGPVCLDAVMLAVLWAGCWWLARRNVFIRI